MVSLPLSRVWQHKQALPYPVNLPLYLLNLDNDKKAPKKNPCHGDEMLQDHLKHRVHRPTKEDDIYRKSNPMTIYSN